MKTKAAVSTALILPGLLLCVMLGAGCVDNDKSLLIAFVIPPDDADCMIKVQTGTSRLYESDGLLDVKYPFFGGKPSFYLTPQVENYMFGNLKTGQQQLDTNKIQLERATMRYSWLIGKNSVLKAKPEYGALLALEAMPEQVVYFSGLLDSASTSGDPGQIAMGFNVIKEDVGSVLATLSVDDARLVQLGVHVVVHGTTVGGTVMESNEFVFPISLCVGCLGTVCDNDTPDDPTDDFYVNCIPGQEPGNKCIKEK